MEIKGEIEHKIVFLDISTIGEVENLFILDELGDFISFNTTSKDQRIERLKNCTIAVTNKVEIDREVIDASPYLKLICITATGMNNVDINYAASKGIEVKNVAGYSTESVAQSTFSMLFYIMHRTSYYDDYVKEGKYAKVRYLLISALNLLN